jgi:uncharacterized linocin/CFP29 family protein
MNDILRRQLAPISDAAWGLIDQQALQVLKPNLSARAVVDFSGPHGWELGAVNLGRVEIEQGEPLNGVSWGLRENLPLIEIRIPFKLNQMELDSVTRGSRDPDLSAVQDAARRAAIFEDMAVYGGFEEGGIEGIAGATPHDRVELSEDPEEIVKAVAKAVEMLHLTGIGGPYALVLAPRQYHSLLQSTKTGFPLYQVVKDMVQGKIAWSLGIEGGLLISNRGGDYEITVGQDLAIGYRLHTKEEVELYMTESFTFRVLEPLAAVVLSGPAG